MTPAFAARLTLGVVLGAVFAPWAAAEERLPSDTVVASRGGASITLADIDASLLRIPQRQRGDAMNSPKRIEDLINQLLLSRQLSNAGKEQGLDRDPLLKHAIELAGENVVGGQAILKFREDIQLGDLDTLARERYNANPARYDVPATVTAQHILIDVDNRSDADALALANQIHTRAAKEDFEKLVLEYSDDPTKHSDKGIVHDADSAKMDPMFAEASSKLQTPGELSPVTKSQFGYHIIKMVKRTPAKARSFDEVRVGIVEELRTSLTEQRVKEHVDQLRSMSLDGNPDAVASLRTRYLPSPLLPDISKSRTTPAPAVTTNNKRGD